MATHTATLETIMLNPIRKGFRWMQDEDGDLVLSIVALIHVVYYKWTDDPIVYFGRRPELNPAPKDLWRALRRATAELHEHPNRQFVEPGD